MRTQYRSLSTCLKKNIWNWLLFSISMNYSHLWTAPQTSSFIWMSAISTSTISYSKNNNPPFPKTYANTYSPTASFINLSFSTSPTLMVKIKKFKMSKEIYNSSLKNIIISRSTSFLEPTKYLLMISFGQDYTISLKRIKSGENKALKSKLVRLAMLFPSILRSPNSIPT